MRCAGFSEYITPVMARVGRPRRTSSGSSETLGTLASAAAVIGAAPVPGCGTAAAEDVVDAALAGSGTGMAAEAATAKGTDDRMAALAVFTSGLLAATRSAPAGAVTGTGAGTTTGPGAGDTGTGAAGAAVDTAAASGVR